MYLIAVAASVNAAAAANNSADGIAGPMNLHM